MVVALGWVGGGLGVPLVLKLYLCGGGSNFRTGRENQIFFFLRTPATVKFFPPNCQKIIWGHHGRCLMPP